MVCYNKFSVFSIRLKLLDAIIRILSERKIGGERVVTQEFYTSAVQQYLDMVYRIALNWFRNPADVEDVAQTVMLRLWQSEAEFEGEEHLRHWLARVTVNYCKDLSRSFWKRRVVPLESHKEPTFTDPAKQTLFHEIMELPSRYRVPLYFYYYEGYSIAEVGELLQLKESTVKTRLARAREKLRARLEE